MQEFPLVTDTSTLATITAHLAESDRVAIDTEFVRERTYYPQLCLIQVATPVVAGCLDCLADVDIAGFIDGLLTEEKTWVLHSARQDLEVVWNLSGRLPKRLLDTQVAGSLLGMAPQASLQSLLHDTLGITISKEQTRAAWNRRPLPAAAVEYALNDVRYLLDALDVLERQLRAKGRLAWLEEECDRILTLETEPSSAALLARAAGSGALDEAGLRAAFSLIEWRESRARNRNRPRRWIMGDDVLVRLAKQRPSTVRALTTVEGLADGLRQRRGRELLDVIASSRDYPLPPESLPAAKPAPPSKSRLKSIQDRIRRRAEELGIAPELIATRRDSLALERGELPEHLATGWRAEVLRGVI